MNTINFTTNEYNMQLIQCKIMDERVWQLFMSFLNALRMGDFGNFRDVPIFCICMANV